MFLFRILGISEHDISYTRNSIVTTLSKLEYEGKEFPPAKEMNDDM